jgi:glutamate racemase
MMSATASAAPIAVFDSGIGGLTVVSALRRELPGESIVYLGDTARVPYGGKSRATIERYSEEIARLLVGEGAKMIVVACNTATALALPHLREILDVPVEGVIAPGVEAALAATRCTSGRSHSHTSMRKIESAAAHSTQSPDSGRCCQGRMPPAERGSCLIG